MHLNFILLLNTTQDEEEDPAPEKAKCVKFTITDRESWQIEAGPEKMNHLKQLAGIILCLFDLEKCRAVARSLEKVRVPFR